MDEPSATSLAKKTPLICLTTFSLCVALSIIPGDPLHLQTRAYSAHTASGPALKQKQPLAATTSRSTNRGRALRSRGVRSRGRLWSVGTHVPRTEFCRYGNRVSPKTGVGSGTEPVSAHESVYSWPASRYRAPAISPSQTSPNYQPIRDVLPCGPHITSLTQ